MLYDFYEWQRASMLPARYMASGMLSLLETPGNPVGVTPAGRLTTAALSNFEHSTRHYGKPPFNLPETLVDGRAVPVTEETVLSRPWCDLLHFRRETAPAGQPVVLLVAPMSGHYATLLRGTVEAFLPDHEVFITDWRNAREVPVAGPDFGFDDYVTYVEDFLRFLGPGVNVVAVCQPAVPVLAAVSLMSAAQDPALPSTMTLIGGPIDTREGPTEVNQFAKRHDIGWFRSHMIHRVPFGAPGFLRQVYPGFLQLMGFMALNPRRHMMAHWDMFRHLVQGDGEPLAAKRAFYEEYRAVMDLPADFYLQTIEAVFHEHSLPRGRMVVGNRLVDPGAITRTALLTIEGERDDISGLGQTRAAQPLCHALPERMREHYEQASVGHYGLFNGKRFREQVAPKIKSFIRAHAA